MKKSKIISALSMGLATLIAVSGCSSTATSGCSSTATSGCSSTVAPLSADTENLTENINLSKFSAKSTPTDDNFSLSYYDFSLQLLKNTMSENEGNANLLLSPLSVLQAMGMASNGAAGNTAIELDKALCNMPISELNSYMHGYAENTKSTDNEKLSIANSVWVKDNEDVVKPTEEFLLAVKGYYNAEVFKAPFDNSTVNDVNGWVKRNTDGMIDKLVEQFTPDNVMLLINAVCFDAKWKEQYEKDDVSDKDFYAYGGNTQKVKMMYSTEWEYLNDGKAEGFLKPYKDDKFSLAVLMPNKDVDINEYIGSLTSESLHKTFSEKQGVEVHAGLPKFTFDYQTKLVDTFKAMGVSDAFNGKADFSKMDSEHPLYISDIIHKTHIEVDEQGTKAAAVTGVMMDECEGVIEPDYKTVILDRPFIVMIVDNENNLPIFMGAVMEIKG